MDTPLVDRVSAVIIGASDLGPHLDMFCHHLGFDVVQRGTVPAATAARLWGIQKALEVLTLAAANSASGRVHLIRVDGTPPERPHTRDFGLIGVNVYTRDIEAAHAELTADGYPWIAPPSRWQVPINGRTVDVTEGICLGPDGLNLVVVQPDAARNTDAWVADPDRAFTEMTSVSAHVPDPDAEIAFWGAMGIGCGYDVTFGSTGLETMTGLDAGTIMRLSYLTGPTGATSRIELPTVTNPQVSAVPGRDRRTTQRPGRDPGQNGWVVSTADVHAAVGRAVASGGTVRCRPFEVDAPPYGRAIVAGIQTPNDISVDLVEPAGPATGG